LGLALIGSLAIKWEENVIWWVTVGGIEFTLFNVIFYFSFHLCVDFRLFPIAK
jgi:hypothetical protein